MTAVFILMLFVFSNFEYRCFLEYMQINLCNNWELHFKPFNVSAFLWQITFCLAYCCCNTILYCFDNNSSHFEKTSISLVVVRMAMCHLCLFIAEGEHFLLWVCCASSFSVKWECCRHWSPAQEHQSVESFPEDVFLPISFSV